jgi:hypothetical protein
MPWRECHQMDERLRFVSLETNAVYAIATKR